MGDIPSAAYSGFFLLLISIPLFMIILLVYVASNIFSGFFQKKNKRFHSVLKAILKYFGVFTVLIIPISISMAMISYDNYDFDFLTLSLMILIDIVLTGALLNLKRIIRYIKQN